MFESSEEERPTRRRGRRSSRYHAFVKGGEMPAETDVLIQRITERFVVDPTRGRKPNRARVALGWKRR